MVANYNSVRGGAMIRTKRRIETIESIKASLCEEIAYDVAFNGWTQKEVAGLTGLNQGDISQILRGKDLGRYTVDRLLMILIIFGHKPQIGVF